MRILSYCLLRNHWHLVLWPENDGDLDRFMQRLTGSRDSPVEIWEPFSGTEALSLSDHCAAVLAVA